jgi:hypothetical protein
MLIPSGKTTTIPMTPAAGVSAVPERPGKSSPE